MTGPAVPPHVIERARAIYIEDEIARRGIRLRGGIERSGPCPVCGGTDRFAINIRKQVFLCRGCGVAGDVIKLVQHIDGCTFIDAVETLSGEHVRRRAAPPTAKETTKRHRLRSRPASHRRMPLVAAQADHRHTGRALSPSGPQDHMPTAADARFPSGSRQAPARNDCRFCARRRSRTRRTRCAA